MFPSPIGELHFSIEKCLIDGKDENGFRPLSGSYISQLFFCTHKESKDCFRPLSGSYISQWTIVRTAVAASGFPSPIGELHFSIMYIVPMERRIAFPSPIGELHFSITAWCACLRVGASFRPLSGSYISQYHPRNPMFCLGQIGGLRGKSNFIEMQPFWKVKNSHKSSI